MIVIKSEFTSISFMHLKCSTITEIVENTNEHWTMILYIKIASFPIDMACSDAAMLKAMSAFRVTTLREKDGPIKASDALL